MVHCFQNNGYNIVLDRDSGSIHVLDDVAYVFACAMRDLASNGAAPENFLFEEVLDKCDFNGAKEPNVSLEEKKEAFDELVGLIKSGELFTTDSYAADIDRFTRMPTVIKAACLNVSHDCNLACKYCFAGEGEYHGHRELMSAEIGKRALEFLIENSGMRKNIEVDFFGGEPLMNFGVVKELVAYGRKLEKGSDKTFRFTLTTNAMLIDDEFIEFADRELYNVVLSLDGRKEVHDRMRPNRGGNGSYDTVVSKIQDFVKKRGDKKHYIRGTFTAHNLDFYEDILHMADLGFKELSMEPVVAPIDEPYAIKETDVSFILDGYDALAKDMAQRQGTDSDFNFFHFMIDLSGGPCVYKRLSGCGAGSEYVAITPNGDIYPCHQFVGMEDFVIGNVSIDRGIEHPEIIERFKKINVYTKPECAECFANMYCSGGCMANSYNYTGDVAGVYEIGCQLERKRVECAIMLEVNKRFNNL